MKKNFESESVYTLHIYFSDSPVSRIVKRVCHFASEGGMFRVITTDGVCQFWPLIHIFNVRVIGRKSRR
jgi:hypothetical protein